MELAVDSNIIKLRSSCSPGERALSASPVEQQQQQGPQQRPSPVTKDEIEECTNQYFQKCTLQKTCKVVDMLKTFKSSENSLEKDIFACVIHNLVDEYQLFSMYPERELRLTGILCGLFIKEHLLAASPSV